MKFIRDIKPRQREKIVVCIGVFDGLHLGHQALIKKTQSLAKELDVKAGVLSFEPYPQAFFAKEANKKTSLRLMRFRDKYRWLEQAGVDVFFALRFNKKLAMLSGEQFVQEILVNGVGVAGVVVGDDFRFGKARDSGVDELIGFAREEGFKLAVVPVVLTKDKTRCSSSRVRQYLSKDDFTSLELMLGRPYSLTGCVRPGEGRGQKIGVPTANVHIPANALPIDGVYVVEVIRPDGGHFRGVANIGNQPTFSGEKKRLEVHLFDFYESAYGEYWKVIIREKIRDVKKFSGVDELIFQIHQDIADGKRFFRFK